MDYLVAVDGSAASEAAVERARRLAECCDGAVRLVHAVDPSVYANAQSPADEDELLQSVEAAEERGEELLDSATERVRESGVPVAGVHLRYGEPTAAIPEVAEAESVDGIVVGHRGETDGAGRILGSVAMGLIGGTELPVTVVQDG
jgi:nucleotide-binding universal stress UspA family protein